MDLIKAIRIVEEKDRLRNRLLGQKSMLVDNLKELGFKNLAEAEKEVLKLSKEVKAMNEKYEKGEEKFKKEYENLLTQ